MSAQGDCFVFFVLVHLQMTGCLGVGVGVSVCVRGGVWKPTLPEHTNPQLQKKTKQNKT